MILTETTIRTFKDLKAWQKSYQLCLKIYDATKTFPAHEQYGLISQIRRCALSVPSNIAEGYARHQSLEYIRFLYISYASLAELETQLLLSKDIGYLATGSFTQIMASCNEAQLVLYSLIKSLKRRSEHITT